MPFAAALANHLWQSTVTAGVLALLAVLLRRNHAAVRYWLWFAASMKFLVPLSLFVALGHQYEWRAAPSTSPVQIVTAAEGLSHPFAADARSIPETGTPDPGSSATMAVLFGIWLAGALLAGGRWLRDWRRVRALCRRAVDAPGAAGIPTRLTIEGIEPGIAGVFRQVLLLPSDLGQRINETQVASILDHELCHARRRDNLRAAFHMVVETLFWFHPLVWWLERRLVEERERACDEAVLHGATAPEVYAEAILAICRNYRNAPLPAAGVSGASLTRRIESIMRYRGALPLSMTRKLLVTGAALLLLGAPVTWGMLQAAQDSLMSLPTSIDGPGFEVASVKPNNPDDRARGGDMHLPSGRFYSSNQTLRTLIEFAYAPAAALATFVPLPEDRVIGGPDWIGKLRFTTEGRANRAVEALELQRMVRQLLAERFQLKVRIETRQKSSYELVRLSENSLGPKLRPAAQCGEKPRQGLAGGPGKMMLSCASIGILTFVISEYVDRPVFDRTGLTGFFEGELEYSPSDAELALVFGGEPRDTAAVPGPSINTALQEQFGLRLVSRQLPVEYLMIESAQLPSEN